VYNKESFSVAFLLGNCEKVFEINLNLVYENEKESPCSETPGGERWNFLRHYVL
jgi:hypothetical protein